MMQLETAKHSKVEEEEEEKEVEEVRILQLWHGIHIPRQDSHSWRGM